MSQLFSLIYASRLAPGLGEADIANILRAARHYNPRNNLTGYLVFSGEHFLQILEGPSAALTATLAHILQDRRHTHSELLAFEPIHVRRFSDWAMGYAAVATQHQSLVRQFSGDGALSASSLTGVGALGLLMSLSQEEVAEPAPRSMAKSLPTSRSAVLASR